MDKIERVVAQQREVSDMQAAMASAFRYKAAELVGTDRPGAARLLRRSLGCEQQVRYIEEVIAATSAHLAALQLTAVHTSSLEAATLASKTLAATAPQYKSAVDSLDTAAEALVQVEELQSAFAALGPAVDQADDDALLATLEAPPAVAGASPAALPALPGVPVHEPTPETKQAELSMLLALA